MKPSRADSVEQDLVHPFLLVDKRNKSWGLSVEQWEVSCAGGWRLVRDAGRVPWFRCESIGAW